MILPASYYDLCLQIRHEILLQGAPTARFKRSLTGEQEWVTEIDLMIDQRIQEFLAHYFPNIPVITEESAKTLFQSDYSSFFVLDPIDGTRELVLDTGNYAISLAYIHNHQPMMGCLYFPARNEFFYADETTKPLRNHLPLIPSESSSRIVLATGIYKWPNTLKLLSLIQHRFPSMTFYHLGGATSKMVEVITGNASAYFYLPHPTEIAKAWDLAAGHYILQRAQMMVTDAFGAPIQYTGKDLRFLHGFVVATAPVYPLLMEALQEYLNGWISLPLDSETKQ